VQNAGTHSFSVGITEVLNTNLLIELRADDIEYVYQRYYISSLSLHIALELCGAMHAIFSFDFGFINTWSSMDIISFFIFADIMQSNIHA